MKTAITAVVAVLLVASTASYAHAEVPAWVKNNAGWWAEGAISESDFLSGIEFLIRDGLITVSNTASPGSASDTVPDWVKANAGWWAEGAISDGEFVSGIEHLMSIGLISVAADVEPESQDSKLAGLEAELAKCSELAKAYQRLDCEKPLKKEMLLYDYQTNAEQIVVGPITYHWFGVGSEGNEFEISASGQPLLAVRMLAENTSSEIVALNCTSPQICNYDVWDGSKAFKYSGMDFTSGQIVLNPGDSREFNMLFGPNIGYGGTQFEYDPSKGYTFRISEGFGRADVQLDLG